MTADQPIIINTPYEEPARHWLIHQHEPAELISARRKSVYFIARKEGDSSPQELALVNRIRPLVKKWRQEAMQGKGGVTRMTMEFIARAI